MGKLAVQLFGKKFWRGCGRGGAEVREPGVRSAFGEWRILACIGNHMKTF